MYVANDGNGAIGVAAIVQERGLNGLYVQTIGGGEILENVMAGYLDCTIIQDWHNVGYEGLMEKQIFGLIIVLGSVQQYKSHKDMLVYAATKEAQMSFVKNLAKQIACKGITVNN